MSTYLESYCNTTTDLQGVEPNIDAFDRKRKIQGVVGVAQAGSPADVYTFYNTGYVTALFRDGADLGAAQASSGAVDGAVDGEWYYDATGDYLRLASIANPDTDHLIEAGRSWATVKTEAVAWASGMVRDLAGKAILPLTGTGMQDHAARDYQSLIVLATAHLACAYLIRPYDFEQADRLTALAHNADGTGWLDLIRKGEIPLHNETAPADRAGRVSVVSRNAASTGAILDIDGQASVAWDAVKVTIITGGTFAPGSASSVTYSVWVGDTTGLANTQVVTAETITGAYQPLAHGMLLRFGPGVYTANDEWQVIVSGKAVEAGVSWGSYQMTRL